MDTPESNINTANIIAVIRAKSSQDALIIARALNDTSVAAIEITMTVPDAFHVIETLIGEGVRRVGAGTVRTVEQVKTIARLGGEFVVSPHLDELLVKVAVDHGLKVTPGTLTPTEMVQALSWGATTVKVFPIAAVGGLSYVESVLEPLPDIPIIVSGGVVPEEVMAYMNMGVTGVCLGGTLWDQEIVSSGNVERVKAFAERVLATIK